MNTKRQELEILDKAIAALGPDSYIGPWLAEVRAEVESNIRSDFFPQITLADSQEAVAGIINAAKNEAVRIIAQATLKADVITKNADKHRDNIVSAIYAAQREINKW